MPHVTVDYSPGLAGTFDRHAFAAALHTLVVEAAGSQGTCKVFFRAATETYVMGCEDEGTPVAHVEVALLPGRSEGTLARLSAKVLELLRTHLGPGAGGDGTGGGVVCSVEVRPLAAYSLYPTRLTARAGAALRSWTRSGRRSRASGVARDARCRAGR
ncbi:5-carboxymethyl-2-hydroxymuconate Delta-isomerase [Streptomyces sp. NPDC059524]|uniref:5-carboxymethyl-2-hydroxymuconate Delta-isomerase n=1 Tax=Streptomyces sp. NPDC059524 TaxID=3346856 RepID=UPI0036A662BB